jgi:hypothetical protein
MCRHSGALAPGSDVQRLHNLVYPVYPVYLVYLVYSVCLVSLVCPVGLAWAIS